MTRKRKHQYFGDTSKPTGPLEDDQLERARRIYVAVGADVHSTRQYRASRQALGLPDFYVMHPRIGGFWHEGKRRGGIIRPAQLAFIAACKKCRVPVVIGGPLEAEAFLVERGLVVSLPNGMALTGAR